MRIEVEERGFDDVIRSAKLYLNKVIMVTNEIGEESLKVVLDRVKKGRTTAGYKMEYRNSNDMFWYGKGKSKRVGDYSSRYVGERYLAGKADTPMDLNLTGGLYRSFRFRKRRSKPEYKLEFFIRKNKNKKYRKDYTEIHYWLSNRFGAIFEPNKQEINKIGKIWKNKLR